MFLSVFSLLILINFAYDCSAQAINDANCAFSNGFCRWSAVSEGSSDPNSRNSISWRIGSGSDSIKDFAVTKLTTAQPAAATTPSTTRTVINTRPGVRRTTPTTTTTQQPEDGGDGGNDDRRNNGRRDDDNTRERDNNGGNGNGNAFGTTNRPNRRDKRQAGEILTASLISPLLPAANNRNRERNLCLTFWMTSTRIGRLNVFKTVDGDTNTYEDSSVYSSPADGTNNRWQKQSVSFKSNSAFKLKISALTIAQNDAVRIAQLKLTTGRCYQQARGKSDTLKPVSTDGDSRGLLGVSLWPDLTIPFELDGDSTFTDGERSAISRAVNAVNQATCIRFAQHKNEDDFVVFRRIPDQDACRASVGYQGGQQDVELGSSCLNNAGEMLHLMMHLIGFQHEHQRADRDDFLTVDLTNVNNDGIEMMQVDYSATKVGEYDYTSVTHFGPFAYAINNRRKTITPNQDTPQSALMGQRFGLSFGDIDAVNEAYSCSQRAPKSCSPPCRNGGTCQGPNFCVCRTGYSGAQCQSGGSSVNDCQNGGTKRNDICVCQSGYIGQYCETPRCSRPCQNGGTCTAPETCSCRDGFSGAQCQNLPATTGNTPDCPTDEDCDGGQANGVCSPSTGRCRCAQGWSGRFCRIPICSGGCGTTGQCTAPNQCTCNPGYTGAGCSLPVCDGGCGDNGQCVSPNVCRCKSGWSGNGCTTPTCAQACINGGFCSGPNTCTCTEGFGGPSCADITKATIPLGSKCSNSRQCLGDNTHCDTLSSSCPSGICSCQKGYTNIGGSCLQRVMVGQRCDTSLNNCAANADCVESICTCRDSYKRGPGNRCARDTASQMFGEKCSSPSECYYDLTCRVGQCVCPIGTTISDGQYTCRQINYGDKCFVDEDCGQLERSDCINGTCVCKKGYRLTSYTGERNESMQTCAIDNNIRLGAGSTCSLSHEQVCIPGYACIACRGGSSNDSPKCLWPGKPVKIVVVTIPVLAHAPTFASGKTITILLFLLVKLLN